MALQDRVMEETKDRKNALESYVYDMRNKLSDKYQEYITDSEREAFLAKLQEVEDWLYEDGEDETKGVYVAKLEELKKVGDPVEVRYKEEFVQDNDEEKLHLIYSIARYLKQCGFSDCFKELFSEAKLTKNEFENTNSHDLEDIYLKYLSEQKSLRGRVFGK
ncbi:unnamed protein product [Arabidopsis halleri]